MAAEELDAIDSITGYDITGGADREKFTINDSGELSFKVAPDFETPASTAGTNVYTIEVTATGGEDTREKTSAPQTVDVTVTDVNEAPSVTGPAAFTVAENQTAAGAVTAEDVDDADSITGYVLTGGDDREKFTITDAGELNFKVAPDFEAPASAAGTNVYAVEVTATGGADTRAMTSARRL